MKDDTEEKKNKENENNIIKDDREENRILAVSNEKNENHVTSEEHSDSDSEKSENMKRIIYKFHTAEMEIKFIDDSIEENLPISLMTINGMNILYVDTPEVGKAQISSDICLLCEVFNNSLQVWEPLIENWPVQVNTSIDTVGGLTKTKISVNAQEKQEEGRERRERVKNMEDEENIQIKTQRKEKTRRK
eukprot:TRINITY_DN12547_c0_g1_i1.p1 TRINITY_DN12547_c0_g1~~TRINITY_DN12547_c0_g1_i1.p1  ORF type:complete len:190 (-),score=53.68 TRINITY_DN12547_c0_g1_i1:438-1007(-)